MTDEYFRELVAILAAILPDDAGLRRRMHVLETAMRDRRTLRSATEYIDACRVGKAVPE